MPDASLRILFVSYTYWPPYFGGELLAAQERLQALAARGHRVTVVTSGLPGGQRRSGFEGYRIVESPAVHDSKAGRLGRRGLFFAWALGYLLLGDYDVVHFGSLPGIGPKTDYLAGAVMATIARLRRRRTVAVHSLADTEDQPFAVRGLAGRLRLTYLRRLTAYVCVSPALYSAVRAYLNHNAILLPYGVRDDLFLPPPGERALELRRSLGAEPTDVVFIFVGSPTKRKGFDLLLATFQALAERYTRWWLWVVGPINPQQSQNLDPEALALVEQARADPRVLLLGRVDDREVLRGLLAAADIFVFPTRREGFPIAPLEAMAVGKPVIVSRIPGVTDLANVDQVTGLFVEPGDLAGLRAAMECLGTDPIRRAAMGAAAAARVREHFSWREHVQRWVEVYRGFEPRGSTGAGIQRDGVQ